LVAAFAPLFFPSLLPAANFYWKNAVLTGNWSTTTNWSATSPTGADNAGIPAAASDVFVTTDSATHALTYDYTGAAIELNLLSISSASISSMFNMSANTLTTKELDLGTNGHGSFSQSGGTVNITSIYLDIAVNATDSGLYSLSNTAILTANNSVIVG